MPIVNTNSDVHRVYLPFSCVTLTMRKAPCVAKDERGEFVAARARSLQYLGVEALIVPAEMKIWLAREYVCFCWWL